MNYSICRKCSKIVPAVHVQKDGKEYLEKQCPDCGNNLDLISNDAARYNKKRDMMADVEFPGCEMNCLECFHKVPDVLFVETTNRCNMNCPICLTNVPSMGFEFEPGMDYFERLFSHYAKCDFPPPVQLFGGEPTIREDLFDIIALARSYGLSARVVTNGLKLADPEYCEKIMSSGASVLISFDGLKREMYATLRGHPEALDLKLKALENISRRKKGKVVLMTVVDKNFNAEDMPHFLDYCLKNSGVVRGIFLMPLTHVWSEDRLKYDPERTTQEDTERIVEEAVGERIDFVPLGALAFSNLAKIFKVKRMPFLGVHPNCESFALLVSNGEKYVPLNKYLKTDFFAFVNDMRALDGSLEKPVSSGEAGALRKLLVLLSLGRLFLKHVDFGAVVKARGLKAFGRWMGIFASAATGKKFKDVFKERTEVKDILLLILLPFEDSATTETDRLEMCKSCFGYVDVATDTIKAIPVCIWERFKNVAMKDMARKYNKKGYTKGLYDEQPAEKVKEDA